VRAAQLPAIAHSVRHWMPSRDVTVWQDTQSALQATRPQAAREGVWRSGSRLPLSLSEPCGSNCVGAEVKRTQQQTRVVMFSQEKLRAVRVKQ